MPDPAPAPPPAEPRELPPDVDRLVTEALRGRASVRRVKKALEEVAAAPTPIPKPHPDLEPPPPPDPVAAVARLSDAAARAAAHLAAGDSTSARTALAQARAALAQAEAALSSTPATSSADEPATPSIRLPSFRHPFTLVVSGKAGVTDLAAALGVDAATAHALAAHAWARVALRGPDRAALDDCAQRLRAIPAVSAEVVTKDDLLALGPATTVLAVTREGWTGCDEPLWALEPDVGDRPAGRRLSVEAPIVAVPGEVVVETWRAEGPQDRWAPHAGTGGGKSREKRVLVLDVHHQGGIARLVEGVADLRGTPGHDPRSARRSFKALVAALPAVLPGVPVEERRVCSPGGDTRDHTGWPQWEEHSRLCRLLAIS